MSFYEKTSGSPKILHNAILSFLGENGFNMVLHENGRKELIKITGNIIDNATEGDLITCIKDYLIKKGELEVLEVYTKGVNTYTNPKKLEFLPSIVNISDKDPRDAAWFYFKNTSVKITADKIELIPYSSLKHPIWKNRILSRDFVMPNSSHGQFYKFMWLISRNDPDRFRALQTALGYLLHRYNDPSLPKVIIFNDERISFDGSANGGTGKGLLAQAISFCKNLEVIDGQQIKSDSRFKNQRITYTTDILLYDDVSKRFSLDELKSMATSGITVEKKGKDEVKISFTDGPKIMISSNYPVLGSGGVTDTRRRYTFELANYFNDTHTPKDEFGNLFFDEWDPEEWNRFDLLMMENAQAFLFNGLVEATPINLATNKLTCSSNPEFRVFSTKEFTTDAWLEKDIIFSKFKSEYPKQSDTSPHLFTKWIKEYAKIHGLIYDCKNPGGVQQFILKSNPIEDEE